MVSLNNWPSKFTREELLKWRDENMHRHDSAEQSCIIEPGDPYHGTGPHHIKRYELAAEEVKRLQEQNKPNTVLDAAMGDGYGGLVMQPYSYLGLEINDYALEHASKFCLPWMKGQAEYIKHDLRQSLPAPDQSLDIVTSFETIEHIDKESALKLIQEFHRVLKPGGHLFLSTPLAGTYGMASPFHVFEFEFSELILALTQRNFLIRALWEQRGLIDDPELTPIELGVYKRERSDYSVSYFVVVRAQKPDIR